MKTGSVKNVAAFEKLVSICNDLGASYNPSKSALTPAALTVLLQQAQSSIEAVTVARANYVLAVNHRQDMFGTLYPLVVRVVRALRAIGTSQENLRDARALRHQLVSSRSTGASAKAESEQEGSTPTSTHSSSRLDYDSKVDTFSQLIELLQGISAYIPNEPELQLASLRTFLTTLRQSSVNVATTAAALAKARMHRNKVLLGKEGLYDCAMAVKEYIRSVFGVRSEPAQEVSKLRLAA